MRLTEAEVDTIRKAADDRFGPDARVYLFGSRTDDAVRGGDIDLYIELDRPLPDRILTAARFHADLMFALGEQKIDVVVRDSTVPLQDIHRAARENGIALT